MKKISFVIEPYYHNNKVFEPDNDNLAASFISLKEKFFQLGYDLSTNDINKPAESDFVIYRDLPRGTVLPSQKDKNKTFLILCEHDIIIKNNLKLENHKNFNKIFTWDDRLVDNQKYFKLNYSFNIPSFIPKDLKCKDKLCTLIAGNKSKIHPLELYSKREESIDWFEKYHPNDFDFYGFGWKEKRVFHNSKIMKELGRYKFIQKLLKKEHPSYKGSVNNKFDVLKKYKFSICYENAKDYPGYITEKIFDSFFAGCIPIYWGANNVLDYIPKNCFIDKRDFDTYEELYSYISNMDDKIYSEYLLNIETFFNSEKSKVFDVETFSNTVTQIVLKNERK